MPLHRLSNGHLHALLARVQIALFNRAPGSPGTLAVEIIDPAETRLLTLYRALSRAHRPPARAFEARPPAPTHTASDRHATAADDAPANSPAVRADDARATAARLYALVALTYAQRLAAVEETQQQQAAALADVRVHLAQLEARQEVRAGGEAQQHAALAAYQDAHEDIADREGAPDRRTADRRARAVVGIAPDRRAADRRTQQDQDRERFEEAVMAQYVPPPPATAALAAVPRPDELAPHPPAVAEEGAGDMLPVDA